MVLEQFSVTTVGNAYFANRLLHEKKWKSAIVVSSAPHIPRVKFIFDRVLLGIALEYESSIPPWSVREYLLEYFIEMNKLVVMRLRGVYLRQEERLSETDNA
jgi:uncharacterized SAM-binding protein YcdF (DUF218 family)